MITLVERNGAVDCFAEVRSYSEKHSGLMCCAMACFGTIMACFGTIKDDVIKHDMLQDGTTIEEAMNKVMVQFLEECAKEGIIPERTEK